MTVQSIYRILCDAPHCAASVVCEDRAAPDGWRKLVSTDHLNLDRYPVNPPSRSRKLSRSDILAGFFTLMLCPDHHDVFDAHRPQTSGRGHTRSRDRIVNVSCSCGVSLSWVTACYIVGQRPSYSPERKWWSHLPEELRWYATREVAV